MTCQIAWPRWLEENRKRPRRSPHKRANLDKFFLSQDRGRKNRKGTPRFVSLVEALDVVGIPCKRMVPGIVPREREHACEDFFPPRL